MNSFLPGTSAAQLSENARQQRLEAELLREFIENEHDVYVFQAHEIAELWVLEEKSKGYSHEEVSSRFRQLTGVALDLIREHAGTVASAVTLTTLAADMHRSGSIFGRYRNTRLHGFNFIVFQGKPHLRRHLRSHIFLPNSPEVIKFGIGKAAAASMLKSGLVLTFILSPMIRTAEAFFVDNQATIESVLVNISMDMVKAAISGIAAYTAMSFFAASTAGAIAILPLGIGIAVAVATGLLLSEIDNSFQITSRITKAMIARREEWLIQTQQPRREFGYYLFSPEGGLRFIQRFTRTQTFGRW